MIDSDWKLTKEAESLAREIIKESREYGSDPHDLANQYCDGHEAVIYYHRALAIACNCDTDAGEEWLEDCGGIAQPGDSFVTIACRVAFAEIYCRVLDAIEELESENG